VVISFFFAIEWGSDNWKPQKTETLEKKEIVALRLGHNLLTDSALHVAAEKFATQVAEKSDGRLQVEVFPAQQLGTDHQMIDAAREGKLDIIISPSAKLSSIAPSLQYAELPFLFPDIEDAYASLDGETGKMALDQLTPYGLTGVAFWGNGFKCFTANQPLRTPDDFRKLNIRIMKTSIISEQFKALGSNPVPIDFHATYQALKDGVVDGQENPLVAIVNMRFHETQKHLTVSNHAYLSYVFAFSKQNLERLPPDLQAILVNTAKELTFFQRRETERREAEYLETIKKAGVEIYYLSDRERILFQKQTAYIAEKFRDAIGGDIIDRTLAELRKKYGEKLQQEERVYIGLNADMSLGAAMGGIAIQRGVELALDEINRNGGMLGKKVELLVRDHAGIASRAVSNLKKFSKVRNLAAVVGGVHSPVIMEELQTIHREKIPYLVPWAAATSIVDNGYSPNYVFRLSVRDEYAGGFLSRYALRKTKRVALLQENTSWGRSNNEAILSALKQKGVVPVISEWFNWGQSDYFSTLKRIEESGAEALILVANAAEAVDIVKTMAHHSIIIPVISHWGIVNGDFWNNTQKELRRIPLVFLQTTSFFNDTSKSRSVANRYYQRYGGNGYSDISPPAGTAHAYDLVMIFAEAIRMAGSLNREEIRTQMENIKEFEGIWRSYTPPFSAERHDALTEDDFIMARFNEQGRILPLAENHE
ncbi:MAG: DctP family TRAP transporter solute-binding subunit, partial [Desulfamplus sp.]|nr:DctP family TRAP transporter solute-binding subunit [Desulfamplus sp.]